MNANIMNAKPTIYTGATKIFTIAGGFYYFGTMVDAPDGWIGLTNYSMFGSFSGGKGLPGVARGDKAAEVTLDQFGDGRFGYFPVSSCYGVHDSTDLYKFKGTTLR